MSFDDLRSLASRQFGLFTAAQASRYGVHRSRVHTLARRGELRLVRRGVYAFEVILPDAHEELRAAWLTLDPAKTVAERLQGDECAVVATRSAAYLHGLGDFVSYAHEFFVPFRKQSRAEDVHIRKRTLPASDIEVLEGMKVTSVTRTVLDLLADGEELEHVADVLMSAVKKDVKVDWVRIEQSTQDFTKVYGLTGSEIFDQLSDPRDASLEDRLAYRYAICSALDPEWITSFQEQMTKHLQGSASPQQTVSSNVAPLTGQLQQVIDEGLEPIRRDMKKILATGLVRGEAEDE
ncbi:MAG: type IV toxin-antitoxin system AbiEi family antitoxin domain-containing protein [Rothia sp. (in: high G+C Gram-positive bacteria)]|uniref:type IV toxin-antitoxin system AbiEi family antitoxin domain-containing protein n=1 Tax=Rothia sp. (in: high G+C Gram-positive bacteria) TaxID=1885016 RepID=UPI00270D64ED|nr:type IV toxin-antitoxin system AbiEi family antitoxin domain-containing protein [Rothia sp. (in: high G+C Gram-positive bacteria)]